MRLLGGPMSAPSKMVFTGLLSGSTVSHFCQRELQPSLLCCLSVGVLASCFAMKHGPAPHTSGGTLACCHIIAMLAVPLWCINGSVDMWLLDGPTSAPSKMVLMGLLFGSTVSHFCQRELQPSLFYCLSVGVLAPCFTMNTGQLHTCQRYTSILPHSGNVGCAALMQSSSVALSCIHSSSIPDRRNVIVLNPNLGGLLCI